MTLFAPPGKRWTGDRGAIPGEPAYQLDANAEGEGVAALVEVESSKRTLWEAILPSGDVIARSSSFTLAARLAERRVDKRKGRSL